jgi:hypothetical protein
MEKFIAYTLEQFRQEVGNLDLSVHLGISLGKKGKTLYTQIEYNKNGNAMLRHSSNTCPCHIKKHHRIVLHMRDQKEKERETGTENILLPPRLSEDMDEFIKTVMQGVPKGMREVMSVGIMEGFTEAAKRYYRPDYPKVSSPANLLEETEKFYLPQSVKDEELKQLKKETLALRSSLITIARSSSADLASDFKSGIAIRTLKSVYPDTEMYNEFSVSGMDDYILRAGIVAEISKSFCHNAIRILSTLGIKDNLQARVYDSITGEIYVLNMVRVGTMERLGNPGVLAVCWRTDKYELLYNQVKLSSKKSICYSTSIDSTGSAIRSICTISPKDPNLSLMMNNISLGDISHGAFSGTEKERFIQMCEYFGVEWLDHSTFRIR